jgi:hypothetical protein
MFIINNLVIRVHAISTQGHCVSMYNEICAKMCPNDDISFLPHFINSKLNEDVKKLNII